MTPKLRVVKSRLYMHGLCFVHFCCIGAIVARVGRRLLSVADDSLAWFRTFFARHLVHEFLFPISSGLQLRVPTCVRFVFFAISCSLTPFSHAADRRRVRRDPRPPCPMSSPSYRPRRRWSCRLRPTLVKSSALMPEETKSYCSGNRGVYRPGWGGVVSMDTASSVGVLNSEVL